MTFLFVAAVLHHRPPVKDSSFMTYSEFSIDSVCKKGSTLLWDLVQEDTCVRLLKTVVELIPVHVYTCSNKYIHEFEMQYRFRKLINCPDASANLLAQLTNSQMSRLIYVLRDAYKLDTKIIFAIKSIYVWQFFLKFIIFGLFLFF